MEERDRDLQRKNDALFSTQAEVNRCKDLADDLRRREQQIIVAI